jgi:GTP-binding protein
MSLLARYRGEKRFEGEPGADGENSNRHGRGGNDLTIKLPVGSFIKNLHTGETFDLTGDGERIMILKGGRGGAGNSAFKSSVNQTPQEAMPGGAGEEATFTVELRLIADAGLIGLPNAGKTSLLNALTSADAKVGAYAFTTLDPNLGALYGYVVADIPGVIEGASAGKGLGIKFLKHIARTRILVHCISLESADVWADYKVVRAELEQFEGGILSKKPEIIVFTKSDTKDPKEVAELVEHVQGHGEVAYAVSVLNDAELDTFKKELIRYLQSGNEPANRA